MIERYTLIAFDSTHDAIAASKLLSDIGAIVMPTLREIRASCGISLRIAHEAADEASARLAFSCNGAWYLYNVVQNGGSVECTAISLK